MKSAFVSAVCVGAALAVAPMAAQPPRFDDVVRSLRNPDAKVRISAIRVLREAQYADAIVPLAPLVNDPIDEVQLEAIAAELSFFLVDPAPARKKLGFLIEQRDSGGAPAAFARGPLATWPKPAPPELVEALLKAVDDENRRVRYEAIHAVGVIGHRSLSADAEAALVKALDHYDPQIRAAAARVAGRLQVQSAAETLIKTINDSSREVRYEAMRALGEIREARAVEALTSQLTYYGKGEGAAAALGALAQIAHPSSVPVFAAHLTHKDALLRQHAAAGLGRAGDRSQVTELQTRAGNDLAAGVRAAAAFAMQKLGYHYVSRLADLLSRDDAYPVVQAYLIELGPAIESQLIPRLGESDEVVRERVVEVLGAIGGEATLAALQGRTDRDRDVAAAAERAVERIKLRRG